MICRTMLSLGVYVLGAADAEERRRVQAHLPNCRACQAELARIAPLPGLLASVPPRLRPNPDIRPAATIRPSPQPRSTIRRRAAGGQWWRAAAAACAAAAAGVLTGFWLAPGNTPHPDAAGIVLTGIDRASHVSATARLTATSWGTSIELRLKGVPRDVLCRLIVRSRTGATEVGGVWDAWRDGAIEVPASVAWQPSGIASLQVVTATRRLVTIDAHHAPG
ncbi:MAG TPA: zf-HC2 domain-containing protein [Streptosporangiaceae bacterium]|nr:zf-HC2 domain-containing protein [Streptosporangiaceae bacterium]